MSEAPKVFCPKECKLDTLDRCLECPDKRRIDGWLYCTNPDILDIHNEFCCANHSTKVAVISIVHARQVHCMKK